MRASCLTLWIVRSGIGAALLCVTALLPAAERSAAAREATLPQAEPVEMFQGMADGRLDVQFIPKDAARAQLLITNKTQQPLSVKLPASFAGVPVLAQMPPNMFPPAPRPAVPPGQQPQRVGGGAPKLPLFDVAPEKVGHLKLDVVCLDHGRPNPRPAIKYEIRPVSEVTDKQGVAEICELLGQGEISHRAAQLAAWHLSNDMSWEKLGALRERAPMGTKPVYTKKEIESGKTAADKAMKLAQERGQPKTGAQSPAAD
jgi:hypothetical protein